MSEAHPMPTRHNFINLTGHRYGRLLVQGYAGTVNKAARWKCLCDCGNEIVVAGSEMRRKDGTKSCGCYRAETMRAKVRTHGMGARGKDRLPEYEAWQQMIQRCRNPKSQSFRLYGGRGISVCERWIRFENFFADMGARPSPQHSLDRFPDNNGHYEPGNCRWATRKEQCRNKRNNVRLTFQSKTLCLAEWSEVVGIKIGVLQDRLRLGWDAEKTLTTPYTPRTTSVSRP